MASDAQCSAEVSPVEYKAGAARLPRRSYEVGPSDGVGGAGLEENQLKTLNASVVSTNEKEVGQNIRDASEGDHVISSTDDKRDEELVPVLFFMLWFFAGVLLWLLLPLTSSSSSLSQTVRLLLSVTGCSCYFLGTSIYLAYRVYQSGCAGRDGRETGMVQQKAEKDTEARHCDSHSELDEKERDHNGQSLRRDQSQAQDDTAKSHYTRNDIFAWAMVAISIGLAVTGAGVSYAGKSSAFGLPFSFFHIPLTAMLAWAVTLPRRCSPWPVFVILIVVMPYAANIGILTEVFSWGTAYHEYLDGIGLDASTSEGETVDSSRRYLSTTLPIFALICVPFYLGLHTARDRLRRDYRDPVAAANLPVSVGGEIAGAVVPVVLLLSLEIFSACNVDAATRFQYAEHTPTCQKLPQGIYNHFGVAYTGCSLVDDIGTGDAVKPLYELRNATGAPAFEYVWSEPSLANDTTKFWHTSWPTSRKGAWALSYDDMMRFDAVEQYGKEGETVTNAALLQGYTVIYGMFSTQVFTRVARLSFLDVVRFSVSFWEGVALVSTSLLVLLSFVTLGASAELFVQINPMLGPSSSILCFFLFVSLWRIAVNAKMTKDLKKKGGETLLRRPSRESTRALPGIAKGGTAVASKGVVAESAVLKHEVGELMVETGGEAEHARKESAELGKVTVKKEEAIAEVEKENEELLQENENLKREVRDAKEEAAEAKKEAATAREKAEAAEKAIAAMLSRIEALEAAKVAIRDANDGEC